MRTKTAILYLLLLLPGQLLHAVSKQNNQQQFRVLRQGKQIGLINTSQVLEDQKITYLLHSSVQIELLLKLTITESISDAFEHRVLTRSIQKRTVNNKVKSDNTLHKSDAGYHFTSIGEEAASLKEPITQSILCLYYREPAHADLIYSENFQQMLEVQQIGPGKYCIELPNGSTATYTYQNGKLQTVESQTAWGTILFARN